MYKLLFFIYCLSVVFVARSQEPVPVLHVDPYPRVLQEYFKTQTRKSNPVIVRMKLKE